MSLCVSPLSVCMYVSLSLFLSNHWKTKQVNSPDRERCSEKVRTVSILVQSLCLSVCLYVCMYVSLSICLYVSLSLFLSNHWKTKQINSPDRERCSEKVQTVSTRVPRKRRFRCSERRRVFRRGRRERTFWRNWNVASWN